MGSFLIRDGQIAVNKRIRGSIGICLFLLWLPNDAGASLVSSMFWSHNVTLDSFAALIYQIVGNAIIVIGHNVGFADKLIDPKGVHGFQNLLGWLELVMTLK